MDQEVQKIRLARLDELKNQKLLVLTLWQPFAQAIARAAEGMPDAERWKTVENRCWAPPPDVVGKLILIHASMRQNALYETTVRAHVQEEMGLELGDPETWPRGKLVAVVRVLGAIEPSQSGLFERPGGEADRLTWGRWYQGPEVNGRPNYGWLLGDITALAPEIEVHGIQKLWALNRKKELDRRGEMTDRVVSLYGRALGLES